MSKIITELQSLLAVKQPVLLGTVTGLDGDSIIVTSPQGLRRFWVPIVTSYKVGDRVRFQGEVLIGKVASEADIPSYTV